MLPEGFEARMRALLGSEYEDFLASFDRPLCTGLRRNPLKTGFTGDLSRFSLSPVPWCPTGFYYDAVSRPGLSPYHAAGLYYLQEPSAMAPAELLDPQPGERALLGNLSAAVGNYRSAFAALFGGMGGSTREEPAAPGPGGKLDTIPLPPAGSPGGVSAEQLQRKPGESPEEYIARITALLNAAAEAMAIAAMEHRRRLREQKNRPHVKL